MPGPTGAPRFPLLTPHESWRERRGSGSCRHEGGGCLGMPMQGGMSGCMPGGMPAQDGGRDGRPTVSTTWSVAVRSTSSASCGQTDARVMDKGTKLARRRRMWQRRAAPLRAAAVMKHAHVVGEAAEGLAVDGQQHVAGPEAAALPGRLVGEEPLDAHQAVGGAVRAAAHREAQAAGAALQRHRLARACKGRARAHGQYRGGRRNRNATLHTDRGRRERLPLRRVSGARRGFEDGLGSSD